MLNLFERQGEATYDCSPVIDADGSLPGVLQHRRPALFGAWLAE